MDNICNMRVYIVREVQKMWFYIWIGAIIYFTIYFKRNMTNNQKKKIESTTYVEEMVVDGKKKKVIKIKCPTCGNKELGYQMTNSGALTRTYKNKNRKRELSATSISNMQYTICDKCGTSFSALRSATPFINGIREFPLSAIVCSIGELIIVFVFSLIGILQEIKS